MTDFIHGPGCNCSPEALAKDCKNAISPFATGVEFPGGSLVDQAVGTATLFTDWPPKTARVRRDNVIPFPTNRRGRRAAESVRRKTSKTRLHK